MKLMLAQNIRTQRKAHSLTQENLAEAMGVTVGAVSKWENGTTSPDLVTLMGLADLFGTSVDALLGYQLGGHTVQSTVEELHTLQQKKEYQAGTAKAENALQRYHNNFAIVRAAANIYYMAGFEQNNAAWLRRALELQEREMLLFEQNTDPCISEDFIQCESARIYDQLGQREKALEILKNHNAGGINDSQIAGILCKMDRREEAMTYVGRTVFRSVSDLMMVMGPAIEYYRGVGDLESARRYVEWQAQVYGGLTRQGCPNLCTRMQAMALTVQAIITAANDKNSENETKTLLRQAKALALQYDAAPDYKITHVPYCEKSDFTSAADDFGASTLDGITAQIDANRAEVPALAQWWQGVYHENDPM